MIRGKLFVLLLIILISAGADTFGQNKGRDKFAEISNDGNVISWLITVPYESATLTVSAPNGKIFRREFPAGTIPAFALIAERGEFLTEGNFTYEIVLTPVLSAGTKETLAQARKDGKSREVEADFKKRGLLPKTMVESGTFLVQNGSIIKGLNTDAVESDGENKDKTAQTAPRSGAKKSSPDDKTNTALEDEVIPDDLIVQGSACIGFDCANDENFGSDTLRLKEINTRLKFEDTSAQNSGFPGNDWQLTANDSSSGGANKFSIDDVTGGRTPFTITAGAPTNSIFVDSLGRLGLKTATPVLDIHVTNGNTPAMRLEQNASGGFTPQTWDVGGNEANFFIRDLTGGSTLPLRIRPGAPTSSIDIAANGNVGMGTNSPDGPLDISRGTDQLLLLDSTGKLTTKSSIEIKSGGLTFPDGTTQTTAATNGGSNNQTFLGPMYSTHYIGGNGTLHPNFAANAEIDSTTNAIGVKYGGGNVVVRFNVATNANLASASANFVVYKIRYRDSDGAGNNARLTVDVHANHIDTGAHLSDTVLNSNTGPATGTGFTTVTVCKPVDSVYYSFTSYGTWLEAKLTTTSFFGSLADLAQIQVYKSDTCP